MIGEFASYAGFEFKLSARQDDGSTLREHMEAFSERAGRPHPMIADGPELPEGCADLWRAFLALHVRRGSNGFGPSRITFLDLDAYQRVTRRRLASWEVEAIMQADDEFFASLPKPKEGRR